VSDHRSPSDHPSPSRRRHRRAAGNANGARGRWGEDLAARHYRRLGYHVVDRNWQGASGELDLVVRRDDLVVFCEVKARRTDRLGPPAAAVGVAKQRRIRRLAVEWLDEHDARGVDVRFDVVAITGVRVRRYESAF
jgi:putative endonuclease